ncbi:MAG: Conserved exported or envelope protein of unknown function [Marmoricola sp.]|nr:Conserved exported or envelope protein of unknown function [Marmoricola sp.]
MTQKLPRTRRISSAAVTLVAVGALVATATLSGSPATAADPTASPTAACDAISPYAIPCVALGKVADAVSTECRRAGVPDALCVLPLAHKVTQAARDAYVASWVHKTAQFQYGLGDPLPLRDAQWIGTHNSFNSLSNSLTISHADSNQQLTLTQQLDIDVRAIELDLHNVPSYLGLLGPKVVTVCHGQGPSLGNLGCTTEPSFAAVLPEVATWLNAPGHANDVIMLYLEDEMQDAGAYASTIATLDSVLKRPDGTSLIYRPNPAQKAANGCTPMPNGVSRNDIRATGARVILVGSCAPGWSSDVFDWSPTHVESGSTAAYQPYPACDATYSPSVYATQLVRYYEDSTLVSALTNPSRPPADPNALTPAKVQSMTDCGVNLFGFDQLLPEDGRIQATLWSWAPDEPRAGAGSCTLQQASDGRWVAAPCTDLHPAACLNGTTWSVTAPVAVADAAAACTAAGSTFALPRAGDQNSALHAVAPAGAWVNYAIT